MKILRKMTWFAIVFLSLSSVFSRTIKPCQNIDKSRILSQSKAKEIVRASSIYKSIKQENQDKIKINLYSCFKDIGQVRLPGYHTKILGTKCWMGDYIHHFKIQGEQISYDELPFGDQKIAPIKFTKKIIHESLIKAVSQLKVENFLKSTIQCHVDFPNSRKEVSMTINLKNKTNKRCFIRVRLDGTEAKIVKRLYATNSECYVN